MRKILQRNEKVELNSFIDEFVKARQKYFTPGQEWLEAELAEEKISVYMDKAQLEKELDELLKQLDVIDRGFDDIEHRAGERGIAVVQLDEAHLYLGVVLEDQRNIRLTIPKEFLPDLAGVGTGGVPGGRSHLCGHITANGHGVTGHIG